MDNFKLSHKFTFWLQEIGTVQYEQYSQSLKPVSTFSEIQQFWEIFQFLKKTSELNHCDMYLFKDGIKPEWEDTNNVGGGCFKIKIDKKKSNKLWEASVFAVISPKNRCIDVLNGVRIKIRQKFDEIEFWMNSLANQRQKIDGLKSYLKQNLQISDERVLNLFSFNK